MLNQLTAGLLVVLLACRGVQNVPAVAPAHTLSPTPPLAGDWRLALRDTLRRRRAVGTLVLRPTAQRDTATTYPAHERSAWLSLEPFEGAARIDLGVAGGVTALDSASTDSRYPGAVVHVVLSRISTSYGAELRRHAELVLGGKRGDGVVRTDGPSLEMVIQRWSRDTIAGTWESTECACSPRAAGYFLATRSR